jgi:hypothetical protein
MTQALYAHMNNKIKKKAQGPEFNPWYPPPPKKKEIKIPAGNAAQYSTYLSIRVQGPRFDSQHHKKSQKTDFYVLSTNC